MARKAVTIITGVLMGFLILGILGGRLTGNAVREESVVITFPAVADFLNQEGGAVTFEFSFPEGSFRAGGRDADVLLFLDSETMPGLKVGYRPAEKKFYAGLPAMRSGEADILDGKRHAVTYLFDARRGMQALFVDGEMVAEGRFTGEQGELVTGFAVYEQPRYAESSLPLKAQFE